MILFIGYSNEKGFVIINYYRYADDCRAKRLWWKKADEQPVAQSADSSASNTQSTSAESADANDVLNQKLNVYIDCYNNLQADIYRAVNRYANTFDDFRTGPTGKEDDPSPLVPVYPAFIQDCRKDIKAAAELKPAFASLDSAALAFINAAGPLAETINSMNKYYDQDNFKDDAFAGAKAFHKTFIKQFDEFDPIAKKYIAEITIMSGQHAANEIKATEKKEGKSIKYYTLLTMQEAETLNDAVADDSFDVAAVSKQLADFEEHTQKLNEKINVDIDKHRSFLVLFLSWKNSRARWKNAFGACAITWRIPRMSRTTSIAAAAIW